MMQELANVFVARIIKTQVTEFGNLIHDIIDENSRMFLGCSQLIQGGGDDNIGISPYSPKSQMIGEPETYDGSFVLALKTRYMINPIILGACSSDHVRGFYAESRTYDADGQLASDKVCTQDATRKLKGSMSTLGEQGITLDTVQNQQPVRLQVADASHVRISQAGQSTDDHIVLASRLMEKLAELETVITAMATRVNTLSGIIGEQEEALAAETAAQIAAGTLPATDLHIPRILSEAPEILGWSRGSAGSYQADCARISNKAVED